MISDNGVGCKCHLVIEVRLDERPILEEIVRRTGIGYVGANRARAHSNPQAVWRVQSRAACMALAFLLDEFPLRAKKARDYAIWREAVFVWATVKRNGSRKGVNDIQWTKMRAYRQMIKEGRCFPSPNLTTSYRPSIT